MNVLFLGPETSPVLAYLERSDDVVVSTASAITTATIDRTQPDFAVSHGYRHIVRRDVLERLDDRAINLHISLLPWNRGADPNVWSFVEDTPKGVTIHYMDEGIDTGDIIAQREVVFGPRETLRSSYERLQNEIVDLFVAEWPAIRAGTCERRPQGSGGSVHRSADLDRIRSLLIDSWDTPVATLERTSRRG